MQPVISFQDFFNSVWYKIPEVWRSADSQNGNPLQVLITTVAQHFYYTFYLKIAAMDELFDPEKCPEAYLPFLAAMVNWKLVGSDVPSWRNQIRHAPLLYKIKGTKRSITIAEKLIGYSVFMSELWRDYNGDMVAKEYLWNSFPASIDNKPWFRTTSPDIQGELYNDSFSDLLPSFNTDNGKILNDGTLQIASNKYSQSLSTSPLYDSVTGNGSSARLAKASRIDVVFKKDLPLDYKSNGVFTEANLQEALDLFLQFKPFHVYINSMLVLYSLSDYVLGYAGDGTAGTGELPGDTILYRESIDVSLGIAQEETVNYHNLTITSPDDGADPEDDLSLLKGNINIANDTIKFPGVYEVTDPLTGETITSYLTSDNCKIETDVKYLTSLGFTLAGYALNTQTNFGKTIWSPNDFTRPTNKPINDFATIFTTDKQAINVDSITKTFTRLAGSFLIDGFTSGVVFESSGFSNAGNNGIFTVSSVSDLVITCSSATTLVTELTIPTTVLITQPVTAITTTHEFVLAGTVSTAGFIVGSDIIVTGFVNSQNNGTFTVTSITPTSIICLGAMLVNEIASSVTITATTGPISLLSSEYINLMYLGITPSTFTDSTDTVLYSQIVPQPNYAFYSYHLALPNICSLKHLLNLTAAEENTKGWYTGVTASVTVPGTYRDVISVNSIPVSARISLSSYASMYSNLSGIGMLNTTTAKYDSSNVPPLQTDSIPLYTAVFADDIITWTQYLCKHEILCIVSCNGFFFELEKPIHYVYDTANNKFVFNFYTIIATMNGSGLATFTLRDLVSTTTSIYIAYATLEANDPIFKVRDISRNTNIALRKSNKKFNRNTFVDNTGLATYIQTAKYTPVEYFDDTTGTLLVDTARTRNYKTDIAKVYTRSAIITEDPTGTAVNSVTFNSRSPRDTSQWSVYVAPLNEYAGAQQLTTTLFSNFFNLVPIGSSIPYDSIDKSASAQITNRNTPRWQSILATISPSYPVYFYASRDNSTIRQALWTRGSAAKLPIPYKPNSRAHVQGFRRDTALFDRTNLSDYALSATASVNLDKYKYVQSKIDVDYTDEYRNPAISDIVETIPVTETISSAYEFNVTPPAMSSTGHIIYPKLNNLIYTPQYEEPFAFTQRDNYYLDGSTNLKPSFYANNITTNVNPYAANIAELDDPYSIIVTGLVSTTDTFVIENARTTELALSKQDLFVTWSLTSLGTPEINVGLYPAVDYTQASSNVQVIKNGSVHLAYGAYWGIALDPARIVLTPAYVYTPGDTIEIIYSTTDTISLPKYPSYIDPVTKSLVVCDTTTTQVSIDTNTISALWNNTNKMVLTEFTFENNPIISWYRNDTGEFINTCVDLTRITMGITKIANSPIPKLYRDIAIPDVTVSVNGTILRYNTDWKLTSVPSQSDYSYRVVLRPDAAQMLQPYDIVSIEYNSIVTP